MCVVCNTYTGEPAWLPCIDNYKTKFFMENSSDNIICDRGMIDLVEK